MTKPEVDLIDKLIDNYIIKNKLSLPTTNLKRKRNRLGVIWQWSPKSEKYVQIPVYMQ